MELNGYRRIINRTEPHLPAAPGDYAVWIGSHGTTSLVRPGELIITTKGP